MTDLRKAAEMALETLEAHSVGKDHPEPITKTIQALRQALSQPEQEPVAWIYEWLDEYNCWNKAVYLFKPEGVVCDVKNIQPLYTAPPKREWVGLTDDEAWGCWNWEDFNETWKKMEAKLKEKNR